MKRIRRSYTLIEIVVAVSVTALLFGILFFVFSGGRRSITKGTNLSEALFGAVMLGEIMEADMRQIAVSREESNEPIGISKDGKSLVMNMANDLRRHHDEEGLDSIEYKVAREKSGSPSFRVKRNGRLIRSIFLKELLFELILPDDELEPDMQYLRISGVATDRLGASSFPFVRLVDLPLPSKLFLEEMAKKREEARR